MIRSLLREIAHDSGFVAFTPVEVEGSNSKRFDFYKFSEGDSKRFLIFYELSELVAPEILNSDVVEFAPAEFKSDPSFEKNTDLVVIFRLESGVVFNDVERWIFDIEENPYYFKKYFLYYYDVELSLLDGVGFPELQAVIKNEEMFKEYKNAPLSNSLYGVAARIYIKLPFLKLPVKEGDLKPLDFYVSEMLALKGGSALWSKVEDLENGELTTEQLLKEMVDEELEDISPEDL